MTPAALVSVEEYLRTNYEPSCEYIDGVLRQKPMPTRKHGLIQRRLGQLIDVGSPNFESSTEVTVRLRPGKYLVPDLIVQRRDNIQDPYPQSAVHLCVEILSPSDLMSEIMSKAENYHAWGVEMVWLIDPDERRAWEYGKGRRLIEVPATGALTAEGISVPLKDLFEVL